MLKRFMTLALMLLLLQQQNLHAQHLNNPEHKGAYGLSLGINQGYLKDLNFSPLNYTTPGYHVGFFLQKQNDQTYWRTALRLDANKLITRSSDRIEPLYLIPQLEFSWLKKTGIGEAKLNLWLGGELSSQIHYIDWNGQRSFSYMFAHSLSLQAIGDYRLNDRQHISSAITVPLLSLLVRPPYSGYDKEVEDNYENHIFRWLTKGDFTSLNGFFNPKWATTFMHSLSDKYDVSLGYTMRYLSTSGDAKFVSLHNQFTFGISKKF
ncbi:MAG: hypothetical protein AB8F95_08195 [Bacteroidia bacterium]